MPGLSGLTGPSGLSGIFGGGFLPTDLAGLILWLKADASTFQDNLYTVPAVADGDPVGGWQDQSGNASHVTQAVAGNRPILKLNIKNGLPVLRFDGTSDYLSQAAFTTGALSQPFNVFSVMQMDASIVNDGASHMGIDGNDATHRMVLRQTLAGAPDLWNIYAGTNLNGANPSDANWNIWAVLFNGALSQFWINNASQASGDAGAHNAQGITLGAAYTGVSDFWKGDIAEVIVYDPSLSNDNRALVQQYLSARWDIALS